MMSDLKNNNIYLLMGLLFALLASIAFASFHSLMVMEQKWGAQEEYGYAYMVPFITLFFIWQRLDKLAEIEFKLSLKGFVLLLGSLFVILLGLLSATHSITQYGAIMSVVSAVYLFLGSAAIRVIIGPLLLLFLIVPLPVFLYNSLSGFLQLISSEIGVWFIRLFDISVYLEGNVIDLGKFKLQVVEACSGLRYLFPLFSLSVIAAFLYNVENWKRIVVVFSSLPITVFMNSFRIGVIGVLVEYWGIEQAEGFLHDFEGWVIFMFCTALIIIEMWLLLKVGGDDRSFSEVFGVDMPDDNDFSFKLVRPNAKYFVITSILVAISVSIGMVNERDETIPERQQFASFPLTIDDWNGRRKTLDNDVLDELRLDDYIVADYVNSKNDYVNFYSAYYQSQRSGQAAHSPKSCIPGGGWKVEDFSTKTITFSNDLKQLTTNRMVIARGEQAQVVYYWFQQRGRIITNEYLVKLYLFWDSLVNNRTDGSLVRLITKVKPNEDIAVAEQRLVDFIEISQPYYSEYIPD